MRKYDSKTKRTILIVVALCIGIIVIFSLFLKKAIDVGKSVYEISSGSILFDKDENMITTSGDATLRIKWGGDYYLIYNDKNYDLGSHTVVYNSNSGDISLYGKFYEVSSNGKVNTKKGENKVKSSVNSKFYKLADRKYLIIDRTIESSDFSFVTSNYLLVHLDKMGNATLLNDKTSYKTISPTVLRTSAYTFDIANEKLNFGGEDIDLKKIIGSTNEYDEDTYNLNGNDSTDSDDTGGNGSSNGTGSSDGNGSGTGNGTGGNGSSNGTGSSDGNGSGTGNGTGGTGNSTTNRAGITSGLNNNGTTAGSSSTFNSNSGTSNGVSNSTVESIINATKNTSVIRVVSGIDNISVDYVVYDPDNEYKSVYVEVENTVNSNVSVVYMSKSDTNLVIRDLTPNVYYNLKFKYTYYDKNNNLKEYTFDEVGLHTTLPEIYLGVSKISGNKLYYKISFDKSYTVTGGTVNLYLNDQYTGISASVPTSGSVSSISGNNCYIDLSGLGVSSGGDNILTVRLVSLNFNTYTVSPSLDYKFKY